MNGAVINNAAPGKCFAYVGSGVDADNFIIEDGKVSSGCIIRNCYIGQGAELEKGFTAHDSLFFANCSFENGEACAVLAGPYTVSMHKGTLLIGCQTAFMNAGSSTNQSNHMYKLGPVHWGVLERGVKTSSGAYIMFGANRSIHHDYGRPQNSSRLIVIPVLLSFRRRARGNRGGAGGNAQIMRAYER